MQFSRSGPVCGGLIVACFHFTSAGLAERRPLDPPPLVEFRLEEHINEAYGQALESLEDAMACFMEPEVTEAAATFRNTLDQVRLKEAGARLATLTGLALPSPDCPLSAHQARQALQEAVMSLQSIVDSGGYLAEPQGAPIEFEVDEEVRVYRVRWRELESDPWRRQWTGPEVVREIPFVPKAWIYVKATYEDGRFGYEVENDRRSEAPLARGMLFVEVPDLEAQQLRILDEVRGNSTYFLGGERSYSIRPPVLGTFYFPYFRLSSHRIRYATPLPGESFRIPPLIRLPWRTLPGSVRCWVAVNGWDVTSLAQNSLRTDSDPTNLVNMFLPTLLIFDSPVPRKMPRFLYHGKTIGPVSAPHPNERTAFVERIRTYLQEARDWGWVVDEAWAQDIEERLGQLHTIDLHPRLVLELIQEVDDAYESGRLLHEAHVLLRYNLEHLADSDNWIADE